ncbi:hypothetical protein QE152_g23456 [Popillia japonica]|uniref:PiggyBac transposable element-derived protein domain-containing protein n=1 Tax=Popillia japonica TaxID=7064 RepID=A0AAW1KH90_POPJA
MGGVDLYDRMIAYYRIAQKTRKWPVRFMFHFIDLALVNSWIEYRRDRRALREPYKNIKNFLAFRIYVAECLAKNVPSVTTDLVEAEESTSSSDNDLGVSTEPLTDQVTTDLVEAEESTSSSDNDLGVSTEPLTDQRRKARKPKPLSNEDVRKSGNLHLPICA